MYLCWVRPTDAERILGYRPDDVLARHFSFLYDDDIRQDKPHIDLDWASREGRTEDERWITRKDGFRFRALFSLIAIRDTGGDLRGFTHIVHEVEDEDAFLASGSPWTRKSG